MKAHSFKKPTGRSWTWPISALCNDNAEDDPHKKNVLVAGPVHIDQSKNAYSPRKSGGRKYEHLMTTIRWGAEEAPAIGTTSFQMEMTSWQVRWLRCRAWIYAILGLPAFSEHIVPICLALFVPFTPCLG